MYAILSHGGRQYRVSAGDRLIVDRLDAAVGSVVALEPVLLTGGDGETGLGKDLDGMRVAATVVAHRRGRKLRIFKYKAKKRYRRVAGYRSDLTELRIESILGKGAVLPKAVATEAAPAAAEGAGKPAPRARAARSAAPAAAAQPEPAEAAVAAAPKRARAAKPKAETTPSVTGSKRAATTGSATPAEAGAAAPKPSSRARKAKQSDSGADAADKETGDGA
jgi:large subunit ribosomal protein L21